MKFISLILLIAVLLSGKPAYETCPDCGEANCIYLDIDKRYDQQPGNDLEKAIEEVCRERGIRDSATIYLIKANYNL